MLFLGRQLMNNLSREDGFTLIELMIVVAIIGILSAIALPSYLESMQNSRRSDAQDALIEASQRMEVFYARGATYTTNLADIKASSSSDEGYYTIAISAETNSCSIGNCYSLTATPLSTGLQQDDKVKGFRISSLGLRELSYDGSTWVSGWN